MNNKKKISIICISTLTICLLAAFIYIYPLISLYITLKPVNQSYNNIENTQGFDYYAEIYGDDFNNPYTTLGSMTDGNLGGKLTSAIDLFSFSSMDISIDYVYADGDLYIKIPSFSSDDSYVKISGDEAQTTSSSSSDDSENNITLSDIRKITASVNVEDVITYNGTEEISKVCDVYSITLPSSLFESLLESNFEDLSLEIPNENPLDDVIVKIAIDESDDIVHANILSQSLSLDISIFSIDNPSTYVTVPTNYNDVKAMKENFPFNLILEYFN